MATIVLRGGVCVFCQMCLRDNSLAVSGDKDRWQRGEMHVPVGVIHRERERETRSDGRGGRRGTRNKAQLHAENNSRLARYSREEQTRRY